MYFTEDDVDLNAYKPRISKSAPFTDKHRRAFKFSDRLVGFMGLDCVLMNDAAAQCEKEYYAVALPKHARREGESYSCIAVEWKDFIAKNLQRNVDKDDDPLELLCL